MMSLPWHFHNFTIKKGSLSQNLVDSFIWCALLFQECIIIMKCIDLWYMQLYFQFKIQITKSAYTDYWWAAIGAYVYEFFRGKPDQILHITIFIISFLSLFVDNESIMAYLSTAVTKNRTGELATRAPIVAFLTCQVRAASRSNELQHMLWHQANAFRYSDRSESLVVISFPVILFGSSVGGSESRAAYQCPHWKCTCLAFCLNASVVGAREHSSGALEDFAVFCAHIRWRHSLMVTPDPP